MRNDADFYLAFENTFRGSQAETLVKQKAYIPFIQALETEGFLSVLDIGCGRGEWLNELKKRNWRTKGIDTDNQMVQTCLKKGLDVEQVDALTFLKNQADQSFDLICSFHFIEHIVYDEFIELLKESFRVIKPTGYIIFETPNNECPSVAQYYFRMDPTHIHPLPAELLKFSAQHCEFESIHLVRLNGPNKPVANAPLDQVIHWWQHANPDIALIASPFKNYKFSKIIDRLGQNSCHLSDFYSFLSSFETKIKTKLDKLQSHSSELQSHSSELQDIKEYCHFLEQKLVEFDAQKQYQLDLQKHIVDQLWLLSIPIRWPYKLIIRWPFLLIKSIKNDGIKAAFKNAVLKVAFTVSRRPWLKKITFKVLNRWPWLNKKIRQFINKPKVINKPKAFKFDTVPSKGIALSPRAEDIFKNLKD